MKIKYYLLLAILNGLFLGSVSAGESSHEAREHRGADGLNGTNGSNGTNGYNGSDGDSYGAAFGLIQYTYDPTITEWQGQVGVATFSGDNAYSVGVGKKVVGGFLNLNVGTSDGDTGAGAAYGWVFK